MVPIILQSNYLQSPIPPPTDPFKDPFQTPFKEPYFTKSPDPPSIVFGTGASELGRIQDCNLL